MTVRVASGDRRRWQSLGQSIALWLGLFALTIQVLVPLCAAGAPPPAGGKSIVICTAHGFQTLTIDDDGKPVPGAPQSDHSGCFLCLGCNAGGGFTTPQLAAFAAPAPLEREASQFVNSRAPSRPAHISYVSRAPPSASEIIAS